MGAVAETRALAARRWWPQELRLLLIAEAPPTAPDRYFYFEHVQTQDSLFRYVHKGLTGQMPSRHGKEAGLAALQSIGVGLVDVSPEPLVRPGAPLSPFVPDLVERVTALAPPLVVLIKATVHDAVLAPLRAAGVNVAPNRIPFPGSGRQAEFEVAFDEALRAAQFQRGARVRSERLVEGP
jgi:hypothetical protein